MKNAVLTETFKPHIGNGPQIFERRHDKGLVEAAFTKTATVECVCEKTMFANFSLWGSAILTGEGKRRLDVALATLLKTKAKAPPHFAEHASVASIALIDQSDSDAWRCCVTFTYLEGAIFIDD